MNILKIGQREDNPKNLENVTHTNIILNKP